MNMALLHLTYYGIHYLVSPLFRIGIQELMNTKDPCPHGVLVSEVLMLRRPLEVKFATPHLEESF